MTNTACFWDALVMMVVCKPKGKNKALAQPWLSHPILGDYPPAKEPHRHRFRVLGPPHGAFDPPLTSSINILFVLILQRHFEPCDAFFSISYTTSVGSFITPQKTVHFTIAITRPYIPEIRSPGACRLACLLRSERPHLAGQTP